MLEAGSAKVKSSLKGDLSGTECLSSRETLAQPLTSVSQ